MDIILCLYSRYCSESVNFLNMLEKKMDVRKLCVDNESVRQKLIDSEYNLKQIPIVFIFRVSGEVEKIEGNECFEWLKFIEEKLNETAPDTTEKVSVEAVEFINEPEKEELERKKDEMVEKSTQKEGGILNRAQQLQKERVDDNATIPKQKDL